MKKLFLLTLSVLVLIGIANSASAYTGSGSWNCVNGVPQVSLEWDAVTGAASYDIILNSSGQIIGTVNAPGTLFQRANAPYNQYDRYIISTNPINGAKKDSDEIAIDVTTGSCMHVSSVSGTQSANVGDPVSVTGSFVWGSGAATYSLGIYDLSNNLIQGYGGSGLSSSPQTVTTPPGQLTAPSAGNYQICAVGNLGSLTDRKCAPLTVVVQENASMTHTANFSVINVGGSVTTSGSGANVTSCSKSYRAPAGFPSVNYLENYPAVNGNVTVPQTTVSGFSQATAAEPYYLDLTCYSNFSFALTDASSGLASVLAPFLGFVEKVYAIESEVVSLPVNVNALQQIILNVVSSGVTGVGITGSIAGTTGTTPYDIPGVYAPDTIETNLTAPETSGGKNFSSWSGCNYVNPASPRVCQVIVSSVSTPKTVTATYVTVDPAHPDLVVINPSVTSSGLQVGSTLSFSGTAKNNGTVASGAGSVTRLKIDLYNNGSVDVTSDQSTANLSAGAQETETFSWLSTAVGTHSYQVCADATSVINEDENENNNCSPSQTFTVLAVEPDPTATLNVNSSGASGVIIARVSGPSDVGGVTDYSRSYMNNYWVVLLAPSSHSSSSFQSWSGCDIPIGRLCTVYASVGDSKNVTANYSGPTGDAVLNVQTSGTIYPTTVVSSTGHGGTTDYTYISSSDITDAYLVAQLSSGDYDFTSWSGCDSVAPYSPNQCYVSVSLGSTKTLIANYSLLEGPWDYILSNSDPITVDKNVGVGQKVITRTVTSGIPDAISTISLSGVPSGASASIASNPCTPSCSSTITFTVQPSVSNGTYPITVTSQPGAKTLIFNLVVTGSAMNVTCVPSPATAMIGQPVTWTANVTGGSAPYTYVWSGSGVPTSPAPTVNPYTVTYSTIGQKTISAQVTDSTDSTASCPGSSSVQINFDPQFEEF